MPQTTNRSAPKSSPPRRNKARLSAEQQRRVDAFKEWARDRENKYARLSEVEKREIERSWESFKKTMNESHSGARVPYPD